MNMPEKNEIWCIQIHVQTFMNKIEQGVRKMRKNVSMI